ncbi:MAG: hypothetical protein QNJ40_09560 [Xanthomonadales bacterium]|nr:hypothetical protein [Xanthomonadales bacterium]
MNRFLAMALFLCVSGPLLAADHQVEIRNNRFLPEVVTVDAGDTVTWTVVAGRHQLTGLGEWEGDLESPSLGPGQSFQFVFDQAPGEYSYVSSAVEGMQGAVQVQSPPADFVIDQRISAGWFNPDASGQGFLFEYVPSTDVVVAYWFTYGFQGGSQDGQQLWLIGSGTPDGNQVSLEMLEPVGGRLNNPQAVSKKSWGSVTVVFSGCNDATAYFDGQKDQQSGRVSLQRLYLTSLCQ